MSGKLTKSNSASKNCCLGLLVFLSFIGAAAADLADINQTLKENYTLLVTVNVVIMIVLWLWKHCWHVEGNTPLKSCVTAVQKVCMWIWNKLKKICSSCNCNCRSDDLAREDEIDEETRRLWNYNGSNVSFTIESEGTSTDKTSKINQPEP